MSIFWVDFINTYGATILETALTFIAGYVALWFKAKYEKYIDTKTKKDVVKTCVSAVEQLYKDLHGSDKYEKVVESATAMLNEKGVNITELEIKMLVEATVGEFNRVFNETKVEAIDELASADDELIDQRGEIEE